MEDVCNRRKSKRDNAMPHALTKEASGQIVLPWQKSH